MCDHSTPVLAGVAGGSFTKSSSAPNNRAPLCVAFTEGSDIRAVALRLIQVDGRDVTCTAIDMLKGCSFDYVITFGMSFAGFNVIDVPALLREFNKPIIVYMNRIPDMTSILQALKKHFPDWRERWAVFQSLGPVHSTYLELHKKMIHFEVVGVSPQTAGTIVRDAARLSAVPEPVRVSRIIARGVSLREL